MFQAGQKVGVYKLIEVIGKGGFGEVWLAEKNSEFIKKKVAIKLPYSTQVDFKDIKQEATLWEKASGHPNVLSIIDADVFDGQPAIVSEYAEEGSLADILKAHRILPVIRAVEIIIGVLHGLEFLHSKNIIHRDIKPANILMQGDTPRLADFGISRVLESSGKDSLVVGTNAFMSPQAFTGQRSAQTDIWSVGVVLYMLVSGNLPFPQKNAPEIMYAILSENPQTLPDTIDPRLCDIIFKALEKDTDLETYPPRRYQTAAAMREDLNSFLKSFSQSAFENIRNLPLQLEPPGEQDTHLVRLRIPVLNSNKWQKIRNLFFNKRLLVPILVLLFVIFGSVLGFLVFQLLPSATIKANISNLVDTQSGNGNLIDGTARSTRDANPKNQNTISDPTVQEYLNKGNKFFKQKKYDQAIEAYTSALSLNPADYTIYNNRGLAYYVKGNFSEAIINFNQAIEIKPTALAYNNRGVTYQDSGDIDQAIADFRKALEIEPGYPKAINNLNKLLR